MSAPQEHVAQALAVADGVAAQMFVRFGERIPLGDLQSLARPAALRALERWDGRGSLSRFTIQRVRWSVLDHLRTRSHKGPRPEADALRWEASMACEQAADAVAQEVDAESEPTAIEETSAGPPSERLTSASALRAYFDVAAARFTVSLDAAGALQLPDPAADVEGDVERLKVRRAVAMLRADERDVIEQHGYLGRTFDEIAAAEGASAKTVFSRFGRALASLRRALGEGH